MHAITALPYYPLLAIAHHLPVYYLRIYCCMLLVLQLSCRLCARSACEEDYPLRSTHVDVASCVKLVRYE